MHQGNRDMSTNFAASTHEFPDVDVVPVTELERIPKRNWDFCQMARSPMARSSLLLSAKQMYIAPSCEIAIPDLFDPVVRSRGTFSMSASSPPNPQQANRLSANCAKCSGQCPSGLAGSVCCRHGHSDYYHGHGRKPLCRGFDGTGMQQHFWAVGRFSPVNARGPEDRDSAYIAGFP